MRGSAWRSRAVLGAPARYLLDGFVQDRSRGAFPWGTFVVNVVGALLLGLVTGLALGGHLGDVGKQVAGTGFCGAFTTFSTFTFETTRLAEEGAWGEAAKNVCAVARGRAHRCGARAGTRHTRLSRSFWVLWCALGGAPQHPGRGNGRRRSGAGQALAAGDALGAATASQARGEDHDRQRDGGTARPEQERRLRSEAVPEPAGQDARGQDEQPARRGEDAVGRAAPLGRRQSRNPRLEGALGRREVHAVPDEQREDLPPLRREREPHVDERVGGPADQQQRASTEPVREHARGDRQRRVGEVEARVGEGQPGRGDADASCRAAAAACPTSWPVRRS